MSKASKEEIATLETIIDTAAGKLPKLTAKKMFGCHALFANDAVFGLVWKEGRIGVRLPDEGLYDDLMGQKGAAPWKAGKMIMSHWVLVPEGMHKEKARLNKWLVKAHELALAAPKKPVKKKKVVKKKKKTDARRS